MTEPKRGRLPRGMGGIYQRGAIYWIRYNHRGKQKFESSFSTKPDVAEKLLKRRHGEIAIGRFVGADAERVMFEKLAELLEQHYDLNELKSLTRAKLSLSHLREYFGNDRALDITADRVTTYITQRKKAEGAAPSSIQKELAALKKAFKLAVLRRVLPSMPVLPTIAVKNTRKGFFEREEFLAVYEHLDEDLRPLVKFLYLLGWRKGEALGLEWRQVDMGAGVFRIEDTKNDDPRTIPYYALPELAEIIESQRERATALQREKGVIVTHVFFWSESHGGRFAAKAGSPIKIFYKPWKDACKAAGITRIPHDFRRTAARDLKRSGLSEEVIMELCGWRTRSVFTRYFIQNEDNLAAGLAMRADLDHVLASREDRSRARVLRMRSKTEERQSPEKAKGQGGALGRK